MNGKLGWFVASLLAAALGTNLYTSQQVGGGKMDKEVADKLHDEAREERLELGRLLKLASDTLLKLEGKQEAMQKEISRNDTRLDKYHGP